MARERLHQIVRDGELLRVRELLNRRADGDALDMNGFDRKGYTPLMYAVESPRADATMVRLLIEHGATLEATSRGQLGEPVSVVVLALHSGDPEKVAALLDAGADLRYQRGHDYDALIDAVHGRDVVRDPRLIEVLNLLIANGVALSGVSSYRESGLRVLSRVGRFDAVRLLLLAGADARHLEWTPLIHAVALGPLADVEARLLAEAPLEEVDWWDRTAWLVAIQSGDLAKARVLRERGANVDARGRCGTPPLFYAIDNHHQHMLQWLLEIGLDIEQIDDFGTTALMHAVDCDDAPAVSALLKAGVDVERESNGRTALSRVQSRDVALRLLDAAANPRDLFYAGRRTLLGFPPDSQDEPLSVVSVTEFQRARSPRFGTSNPEEVRDPFWEAMIRAGVSGYEATEFFHGPSSLGGTPVWCAQRYGQSITFLPDGRIVQIGGEHEDHYDPDFCIYNDVFVHEQEGVIRLFGYPEAAFPPTDFHTATLVGRYIYVIGSLGYAGARRYGETPVHRLDTHSFRMERVEAHGEAPGWIYEHRALSASAHEIRIVGGKVVEWAEKGEVHADNQRSHVFDTQTLSWRRDSG